MISCTEFIPAYSELFRYLEHTGGKQAVRDFWEHIADEFLGNLRGPDRNPRPFFHAGAVPPV